MKKVKGFAAVQENEVVYANLLEAILANPTSKEFKMIYGEGEVLENGKVVVDIHTKEETFSLKDALNFGIEMEELFPSNSKKLSKNTYDSECVASESSFEMSIVKNLSAAVTLDYHSIAVAAGYRSAAVAIDNQSTAIANGECSVALTSGNFSESIANESNTIALGAGKCNKVKGVKGSWLVLTERNDKGEIDDMKSVKVDGVEIEENTFYVLKGGEILKAE